MNLSRATYHERSLVHGLDDYYSEWGEAHRYFLSPPRFSGMAKPGGGVAGS